MRRLYICLLIVVTPSLVFAEETTFEEILKRVEQRESRTNAISIVSRSQAERAAGGPAKYGYFEIRLDGDGAEVEMYNNYLTGKQGETYTFPLSDEIRAEHKKLQNLAKLQEYDAEVADAQRRRRIFLLSSFQLHEGSDRESIKQVLGEPKSTEHWMRSGWSTWQYADLTVTINFDKVHDIVESPRDPDEE